MLRRFIWLLLMKGQYLGWGQWKSKANRLWYEEYSLIQSLRKYNNYMHYTEFKEYDLIKPWFIGPFWSAKNFAKLFHFYSDQMCPNLVHILSLQLSQISDITLYLYLFSALLLHQWNQAEQGAFPKREFVRNSIL